MNSGKKKGKAIPTPHVVPVVLLKCMLGYLMHRTCKLIDIQISCYFLDLQNASQRRELDALDKALARAKAANFDNQLDLQIVVAQRLRDQLARIEKLRHSVLNMDQKTIAEIRTYSNPPDGVHQSLMGAFLLLGHSMKEVKVNPNLISFN